MAPKDGVELEPDLDRSYAIEALYRKHHVAMAKTAPLLIGSREEGEEIAQDAFVALYQGWDRLGLQWDTAAPGCPWRPQRRRHGSRRRPPCTSPQAPVTRFSGWPPAAA